MKSYRRPSTIGEHMKRFLALIILRLCSRATLWAYRTRYPLTALDLPEPIKRER